jgi:hypothetical protein
MAETRTKPIAAGIAGAQPMDDYQAQDDVRTLVRAHHITKDKKRHVAAKHHARKQLRALQAIGGVGPMAAETQGEPPGST